MKYPCLICAETLMEQMPEAKGLNGAIPVASRIPGARLGCVEVRPIAEDPRTLRALGFVAPGAPR